MCLAPVFLCSNQCDSHPLAFLYIDGSIASATAARERKDLPDDPGTRTSDTRTMASPDAKRTNVASPTEETTAEKYGRLYGIDADTQAALQNVGRRNRQREWCGAPGRVHLCIKPAPTSACTLAPH